MRRLSLALVTLLALAMVQSCSRMPPLVILNDFGRAIEIIHASANGDRTERPRDQGEWWSWPWPFIIDHGNRREVALWPGHERPWLVEARLGSCRNWYEIPEPQYYFLDSAMRIDAEGLIHFEPGAGWSDAVRDVPEFPISPTERRCVREAP
jgi:hypothetical protein